MRYEILTVVKMLWVSWVVMPCELVDGYLHYGNGDSIVLQNVGMYLHMTLGTQKMTAYSYIDRTFLK
jgi:hypothetical protein